MGKATQSTAKMASCGAGSARAKTRRMCGRLLRGNRDISLPVIKADGSVREGLGRNPDVYGYEKSDSVIVPEKEMNNEKQR